MGGMISSPSDTTSNPASTVMVPETHNLTMVFTASNYWTLFMPGYTDAVPEDMIQGPNELTRVERVLKGSGPWLVAMQGFNNAQYAGLMAAVYLDGKPYTMTGGSSVPDLWVGSHNQCNPGWNTALGFDDSSWTKSITPCSGITENNWGHTLDDFDRKAPRFDRSKKKYSDSDCEKLRNVAPADRWMSPRTIWLPSCVQETAADSVQFRLKVDLSKIPPEVAEPADNLARQGVTSTASTTAKPSTTAVIPQTSSLTSSQASNNVVSTTAGPTTSSVIPTTSASAATSSVPKEIHVETTSATEKKLNLIEPSPSATTSIVPVTTSAVETAVKHKKCRPKRVTSTIPLS